MFGVPIKYMKEHRELFDPVFHYQTFQVRMSRLFKKVYLVQAF